MAEFALGLTKTAVDGTLSLVKSAVEEEKRLRDTVQSDLVFITGEFEAMRSFLRVANRERTANDEVALTLVNQLRTLAFDVEDCVEFIVHLDNPAGWEWLRRLWQKVNCRAPPLPLDVAVAEIKQLKARVEDVSQRNTRYHQILHGSDNDSNKQPVTAMPLPYANPSSAVFHDLREAWKATGKSSSNICNLQELLIAPEGEDDHDLQVISVWGSSTGGGGADLVTASIFRKAYSDPKICEKFKIRAWVKLTHPFNHDEFVKSLLSQFCATPHQANAEFTEGNIMRAKKAMMQQMRRQRYLVVLENVFTLEEWNVIRMYLPDWKNGSRILVSTPQLGIAPMCTGEPYQVSELRQFSSDNQLFCAFNKEKTSSDIGEFVRQLLRGHGVISVWGADDDDKSKLVDILYRGIINGWLEEIEGVADISDRVDMLYQGIRNRRRKFELWHSSWVDVPDPFNLKVFAQRLFLNFYSDDIRASEITKVSREREDVLIEWCRQFLSGEKSEYSPYIVVINGLRSKDDWDQIQGTFLVSSEATTTAKDAGCILVITEEETVSTHCVKDHTHLAFNAQDLKADPSISALMKKSCWHYAIRGKKGRLFYDRSKDAREWAKKFERVDGINFGEGNRPREFMVKWDGKTEKCGFTVLVERGVKRDTHWVKAGGNSEKAVLRHLYYGSSGRRCSWVDLPHKVDQPWVGAPLSLMDLSWRLLLDFYSDDPQEKEAVAVGLMEGTIADPIGKCREFLRKEKCLVVFNGVHLFEHDYRKIKKDLFPEKMHTESIIVVAPSDYRDCCAALQLRAPEQNLIDMEYRCIFSTQKRYQDAIRWVKPFARGGEVEWIRHVVLTNDFVSVWGIPGVGKSTLVKTVYYTEVIYSSGLEKSSYGLGPTEAFAWVDVLSPFNLTDFAWRLLLDFYSDDPQAKEAAIVSMIEEGRQVPIQECRKILRTGKCLVVIDGLRSKQDWDVIKDTFLAERIKGTIVVVTDEKEVAMDYRLKTINITGLEANAALSLFEKIALKDQERLTRQEKEQSKSIVAKCGGLPKVIAAIGKVFASKKSRGISDPSWWLWERLSDNFMGTLEKDPVFHDCLRPLFSWMQSYFDACSDSIKPCIFYLSIFPPAEKKSIRRRRLLWRWIVEGYCRDTSDGKTYEENGEDYISELVKLSIIRESANSNVFCEINGFFHEYIISRRMEDNFVFALEEGCSLNSQRAGQHLTIRSTWNRSDEIVYKSIDFSRLRSLTVFGKWKSFFVSINMRLLRVLDLEDATDVEDEHLEEIGKQLTRLKFLSLRGHTKITRLPSSMGGLRQLQTLDIRGTSIVTLPPFITKLQNLRYIRAGTKTEAWDWEGDIVAADGEEGDRASADSEEEEDWASSSEEEGDVVSADGEEEDRASSSAQAVTNIPAPSSATAQAVTNLPMTAATPTEGGRASMASSSAQAVTNLPAAAAAAATIDATPTEAGTNSTAPVLAPDAGNNRPCTLVSSFLSKLCRHGGGGHDNNNGRPPAAVGVTVRADIGNLSFLHTLGVVKVNAQCGNKAIFQELKKLTQLRKLGVSGINRGNFHEFCEAISDHAHLKSLSVEVDTDDGDLDDDIPEPPKAIKSLKLHGRVNKLLVWMKHLDNLEKLHLTIEKPEELRRPPGRFGKFSGHLRIRPSQDGKLRINARWAIFARIIEIQCSSRLHIEFGGDPYEDWYGVSFLKVHFSGESRSSLQIPELGRLMYLEEVWLKGYTDAHKQYMQQQINEMDWFEEKPRPVLKLVGPRSS